MTITVQTAKILVCVAIAIMLFAPGCVKRRMIVRSNPEGAFVTVDRQAIGMTPVAAQYTYAGTREIHLEKDGYETIDVKQRIVSPWYDRPILSLFSNNFAFREIRDDQVFDFEMRPLQQVNEKELIDRANQLRYDVQRGAVTLPLDEESIRPSAPAPGTIHLPIAGG